jgi:hypothetical protein
MAWTEEFSWQWILEGHRDLTLNRNRDINSWFIFCDSSQPLYIQRFKGGVVVVMVWKLDLQVPVQSVLIITKIVSLNSAQAWCTRYNITNVCDQVCQWLATAPWFSLWVLWFPPWYNWNIVESGVKYLNPHPSFTSDNFCLR